MGGVDGERGMLSTIIFYGMNDYAKCVMQRSSVIDNSKALS